MVTAAPPGVRQQGASRFIWPIGFVVVVALLFVFYNNVEPNLQNNIASGINDWIPISSINEAMVWIVMALGLNVVVGYAGLLDLGYVAFWALGEIVKAECGILESDSADDAEAKLERALPADEPDRLWLKARLAPLAGLPAEVAAQEEAFTAWRRFLELLADQRETVLLFEDLHWADDAFLSFLEQLCDRTRDVPLLVLCTARPELYEQHPTFCMHARNAQRKGGPGSGRRSDHSRRDAEGDVCSGRPLGAGKRSVG